MYSDYVKYLGVIHSDVTNYDKKKTDSGGKLNVLWMGLMYGGFDGGYSKNDNSLTNSVLNETPIQLTVSDPAQPPHNFFLKSLF